ncbi:MAG: peptidase S10 [bacterium]|nr:peptidase S10 [bacterium]
MLKQTIVVTLIAFVALTFPAAPIAAADEPAAAAAEKPAAEETESITHHTLTLDGKQIAYTATAGTLLLKDDEGKAEASVFYVAYARDGVDDPADRPVTFSFNGGPGAAALWVQMGAFGPKKVLADDEGMPLAPPGKLVDNPYSILDLSDLVFIDPIGTGFSRAVPGEDPEPFYSFEGDIESVGAFIRLWTTRNGRWSSPKFIAGESYGTTRGAGLVDHLQERYGMYLNGILLISPALNWQDQIFAVGNDLPNLIFLPTYTATAWYHGKLPEELQGDLEATLDEVEAFALGEYASALLQGDRLAPEKRHEIALRLARYTGLSVDYVERSNLRIVIWRFVKELLRAEGKTVGRIDSRFTGWDRDSAGEVTEFDPSLSGVAIGYVTLVNDYLRRTLGYESDLVYEALSLEVNGAWSFQPFEGRYLNVAETLRGAMTRNPELRVLFACGYYDLATPYFDCDHTVAHLGLPEALRDHVGITYYESGHMMYIRKADHAKFKEDVARFIRQAGGLRDQ